MAQPQIEQTPTKRHEVTHGIIDKIVHWDAEKMGHSFEHVWELSPARPEKLELARALLQEVEFLQTYDPTMLAKRFTRRGKVISQEDKALKDSLWFDLLQQGHIDFASKEAEQGQRHVWEFIDSDDKLRTLSEHLDPATLGAIASVQMFKDADDATKREQRREWSTRAVILRPYLGEKVKYTKPKGEMSFRDLFAQLPEQIFENPNETTYALVKNCFTDKVWGFFTQGIDEGFDRIETEIEAETNPARKAFLEEIYFEIAESRDKKVPDSFNTEVTWLNDWRPDASRNKPLPFPHLRQIHIANAVAKHPERSKLIKGGTGSGKTTIFNLAMQELGAQKATIMGTALARDTWPSEVAQIFKEDQAPSVFTINGRNDLDKPGIVDAHIVYISTEFLAQNFQDREIMDKVVKRLAHDRQTDLIGFEEASIFQNNTSAVTLATGGVAEAIRSAYAQRSQAKDIFGEPLPIPAIALSATPISGASLDRMDSLMAMVFPRKFAPHGQTITLPNGKTLLSFSDHCLRDPKIAHSIMRGEGLIEQITQEHIFGEHAPKLEYERIMLEMTPHQRVIYEFVQNLEEDSLSKIRLLSDVLLNPQLIRRPCKERGLIPDTTYGSRQALSQRFLELYNEWQNWQANRNPNVAFEQFSDDWIAKYGDAEFLLECFFDESLVNGMDSLAEDIIQKNPNFAQLQDAWRFRTYKNGENVYEFASPKFKFAHDIIKRGIQQKPDGTYEVTARTMIVDPFHKEGLTRWLEDPGVKDEDLSDNTWSFYENLRLEWLKGMPEGMATALDGSKSFKKRRRTAKLWRETASHNAVVIADMKSIYQSMDWAVRDTAENKNIEEVNVVLFQWTFDRADFEQFFGRFPRPGLGKKVNFFVVEMENSHDQGLHDTVLFKHLFDQMLFAGLRLSPEQQEFYDSNKRTARILVTEPRQGQAFIRYAVQQMRGAGEEKLADQLSKEKNGRSYYDLWADAYYTNGMDRFRLVGNNAKLISRILLEPTTGQVPEKILSVGAGTCLLNRALIEAGYQGEVDNVDINPAVLEVAKQNHPEIGNIIVGRATALETRFDEDGKLIDNTGYYNAVDYSHILDMTELYDKRGALPENIADIERVKILKEMNRVLKHDGKAQISLTTGSLDEDRFKTLVSALTTHFGFSLVEPSGHTKAHDTKPPKEIGWILSLQKIGAVSLDGLNPHDLALLTDALTGISTYKAPKSKKPAVIRVDYPLFDLSDFVITNPLSGEVSLPQEQPKVVFTPPAVEEESEEDNTPDDSIRTPEEVLADLADIQTDLQIEADSLPDVIDIPVEPDAPLYPFDDFKEELRALRGKTREFWVRVLRKTQRTLGRNYEDAEKALYDIIIHQRKGGKPNEWSAESVKLLEKQIDRYLKQQRKKTA